MDPLTILAALGPLAVDAGKALINRFIMPDNFKPANVDEYIKVKQIDLDLFKAMNDVGGTGVSYPWVEASIKLMRPAMATIVLLTWGWLKLHGNNSESVDNFAAAIGFYLFGDRTLFYLKQK